MLELKDVSHTFCKGTSDEKKAINGLNLTVNDGDFVTVIGSNGAGKSTMLNMIAGEIVPDEGSISISGHDVTKLNVVKTAKFVGRVFQDPNSGTCGDMQIIENLSLASKRGNFHGLGFGVSKKEKEEFIKALEPLGMGLEKRLNNKVKLLSGGQRQALTLVMATLKKPELLLLDEHTAALDPKTAALVLGLTEKIVSENKLTTLMITHNMSDAIKYGNRLIMMDEGRIVLEVSGDEKKKLTVEDLLKRFATAGGGTIKDSALLG